MTFTILVLAAVGVSVVLCVSAKYNVPISISPDIRIILGLLAGRALIIWGDGEQIFNNVGLDQMIRNHIILFGIITIPVLIAHHYYGYCHTGQGGKNTDQTHGHKQETPSSKVDTSDYDMMTIVEIAAQAAKIMQSVNTVTTIATGDTLAQNINGNGTGKQPILTK